MSHVKVLAFQVFHDQTTQEREAKKKEKLQKIAISDILKYQNKCRCLTICELIYQNVQGRGATS